MPPSASHLPESARRGADRAGATRLLGRLVIRGARSYADGNRCCGRRLALAERSTSQFASRALAAQPWLPFEELVEAHWAWQHGNDPDAESAYRGKLSAFEAEFGEIV